MSQVRGLSFSYLTNFVCGRQIKAPSDIAERILGGGCDQITITNFKSARPLGRFLLHLNWMTVKPRNTDA